MPFKLRLKRSRQYNVVSKSLFVIGIELLDSTSVECTLTAESVGRECLDNICQRLSFHQPEFFGLRYVCHNGDPRWVELERPLKRQLDKHARNYVLYLRIMYYVSGINLLTDEMTRYHYFLQLKSDVVEGRISCDADQAVLLASYCMQAEFGNYDVEKHTPEYLKDFALFPKHLVEQGNLEQLTEAVIFQHASLANLPQGTAEEYYILAVQQLDGYGHDSLLAKDDAGNDVIIGITLNGIAVTRDNAQLSKFYRWKEITNVINHKRNFGIECQSPENSIQFQFRDRQTSKYVWRMCVHQHTFYIQYGQYTEPGKTADIVKSLFGANANQERLRSSTEDLDETDDQITGQDIRKEYNVIGWHSGNHRARSASSLDLPVTTQQIDKLRSMLPTYRQAPDYNTAVRQKYEKHNEGATLGFYSSHPDIHSRGLQDISGIEQYKEACRHYPDVAQVDHHHFYKPYPITQYHQQQQHFVTHTYSTPELDGIRQEMKDGVGIMYKDHHQFKPQNNINSNNNNYPPCYNSSISRPSSNSTPDLASQSFHRHYFIQSPSHVSGSSPDLVSSPFHHQLQQHHGIHGNNNNLHNHYPAYYHPIHNPQAHRTYTNLTTAVGSQQGLDDIRRQLIDSSNIYGQNGMFNKPPYPPSTTKQYPGNDVSEPIYENVPLPWKPATIEKTEPDNNNTIITESLTNNNNNNDNSKLTTSSSSPSHSTSHSFDLNESNSSTLGKGDKGQKKKKRWAMLGGLGGKDKIGQRHQEEQEIARKAVPMNMSKEAMCVLLEKKLEDSQLIYEFEKIPIVKANADFHTALLPENILRNRNKDIIPYEENRVRLSPSKENKYGYINASNITASVRDEQKFYIAAESPLMKTVSHFWQMIWESDVYLVVCLVDFQNEQQIQQYCPIVSTDNALEIDQYQVCCQFSQETGHCVTSKLRVFHRETKRSRGVWHLQYTQWATDGCPKSVPHFLGFLEELNSVRQHTSMEIPAGHNKNPPVLVHCGTGVTRTAITILSDLLLYTLDHNQDLDIPRLVMLMRHQRMLMIDTITQYRFVHRLLVYYLNNSRLI